MKSVRTIRSNRNRSLLAVSLLAVALARGVPLRAESNQAVQTSIPSVEPSGLYVRVQLSRHIKISKLRPGDSIEGTLVHDVYSSDHKVFSSGSHVLLTVDQMAKRRRAANDHWPWIVKAFTPRRENYPVFRELQVTESGSNLTLPVALISISNIREVHPPVSSKSRLLGGKTKAGPASQATKLAGPTLVLEAFSNAASSPAQPDISPIDPHRLADVPAGTRCRIVLLDSVSASKSKPGDVLTARLLEPIIVDSNLVLPAGSVFEGKVLKKIPPRTLSRSGALNLTFTSITLPGGNRLPITASVSGAVVSQGSHTRIDREGVLHGERPGSAWMAINIGMTAGISKEVDDGVQLVIEALISTATDASTAGTSRIISSCVSGIYMATRRGRDIVLPRFTEMEITIDRPLSVSATPVVASSN